MYCWRGIINVMKRLAAGDNTLKPIRYLAPPGGLHRQLQPHRRRRVPYLYDRYLPSCPLPRCRSYCSLVGLSTTGIVNRTTTKKGSDDGHDKVGGEEVGGGGVRLKTAAVRLKRRLLYFGGAKRPRWLRRPEDLPIFLDGMFSSCVGIANSIELGS